MKPLKDYLLRSFPEDLREQREKEFREWEETRDFKEANDFNFRNRNLFVNHKGEDFYHELETWSHSKYSNWITEVINETLKSPDSKALIKALTKVVGDCEHYTENYDVPGLVRVRIPGYKLWLDKILEVCQFFRYYISCIDDDILFFEPVLTTEVTKEIKKDYGNRVYHLCPPKEVESILKNGLIVSGATGRSIEDPLWHIAGEDLKTYLDGVSDNTIRKRIQKHTMYRIFPNRVFVFYTNLDPLEAKDIICNYIISWDEREIIEIDLKHHNIPFFTDASMRPHNDIKCAYSNIDIPPKLLKLWKS